MIDHDDATRVANNFIENYPGDRQGQMLARAYLAIKADNEKYRSALQWYADKEIYGGWSGNIFGDPDNDSGYIRGEVDEDAGQRARDVLEGKR